MVPEGWTEEYVKGLVRSLDSGVSVNSEDDGNENATHKILKTSCVSHGYFKSDETKSVIEQSEIARLREPVIANSIIISRMNTPALVGANAYVETALNNTYLPDRLWQIKTKNKVVEVRWLAYWFGSAHTRYRLSNLGTGTSGSMKNITKSDVLNLSLLVPPLPEQKKIAQILSTWDKAITTTEQLLANSQQQKKALMQQLLTGKKRLLNKNGDRFSGEWKVVEIGRVLKEVKRPVDWDDDAEYKLLSVKRRSEGVVLREVLKGSDILTKKMNVAHSGDFLISKMQIVHGAAGLVSNEFDGFHVSDSYISLIPKDECKLDIHFFAWFAKQKLMYHIAFLCSYGVHIEKMTFNFKLFLKEKIWVPASIEEQQKIATVLSSAEQEISALQQKLDALKQEKKALMQQLLTGKRRVKVDEVAA
ncbi:restriction endonuclease subunit S [Aliidiomarina sanyensis]|uniref:Restriction endonuclease subunit S n=1 Tax=Aliidiomarina sanyensis TaxID=1249555 RepID=A0A432WB95_9GAMM|nr:restriction endonuclease subunit S [Aliidiomarina sanyensis]RUO28755.1 restriction endonuclease subunit S [Aliidiomarina sanyensis]